MIDNSAYGGFIVSRNILRGKPVGYSFREQSAIPEFNGWNFYSFDDDEAYISDPNNFVVLSAESVFDISPAILAIFDAPYGTDLAWVYKDGEHVAFYDMVKDKEISITDFLDSI